MWPETRKSIFIYCEKEAVLLTVADEKNLWHINREILIASKEFYVAVIKYETQCRMLK